MKGVVLYTVRRNANNLLDLFNWTVAVKHIYNILFERVVI